MEEAHVRGEDGEVWRRGSEVQSEEGEQPLPRLEMPRGSCHPEVHVNVRGKPQASVHFCAV